MKKVLESREGRFSAIYGINFQVFTLNGAGYNICFERQEEAVVHGVK
jgi:hypothetical protein